jgi:thiosulfate dehydrogenase [quinone] large subunit
MNANRDTNTPAHKYIVTDPPFAQTLFGDWRWAWLWLIVRLYVGYGWISAGWGKITSSSWVGAHAGTALQGFLNNAISLTGGAHPTVQAWYAAFLKAVILPAVGFWSYVVAFGETLVGAALILGVFTGIAAFFGFFMNMNYLLAGSVSTNPILLFLSIFIVLAWKTAGWWGLDRWVLVDLGTPWSPGLAFQKKTTEKRSQPSTEMKSSK